MITQGPGSGQGQGQGQGGGGKPGQGPGLGHRPRRQRAGQSATNPKSARRTRRSQGNDTGQGGSRSEVILGAAERGFASKGYTKVYREYHTVAEEALNKDEIPAATASTCAATSSSFGRATKAAERSAPRRRRAPATP